MQQIEEIKEELKRYYECNLRSFGPSAMGMGWKSKEAQQVRFDQMVRIIDKKNNFSINDLGCGMGDFFVYLAERDYKNFRYTGYDMFESMLLLAKDKFNGGNNAAWVNIQSSHELRSADYTIASGIFHLKCDLPDEKWIQYILETLHQMDRSSKKGFAFNMLTIYSDKEYMKDNLYYSDPLFFFDFCKKNFSKNVALLHDYFEYDFTILVKK
jgi:cyclopropane fatty-acyl-phospholipid synthase-like methyltransferase